MGEVPVVGEHRVLVRPEARQDVVNEGGQSRQGLGARGRPGSRRCITPCVVAIRRDDVAVDLVEFRGRWGRPDHRTVTGWWLTIFRVEVPLPADRLVALDQVSQTNALPTIEVLHLVGLATGRKGGEVLWMTQELSRSNLSHAVALEELSCRPAVRLGREDLRGGVLELVCFQASSHRVGDSIVDFESFGAQFGAESTHGGDDQMDPLDVPGPRADLADRFDHQDPV